MHVTLVHVQVNPQHIDDFIAATHDNRLAAISEPGNHRFAVLQAANDPSRFVLYEAYNSAQHAAAHKGADHYLRWRERVVGKVPRTGFPV